jgi:cell division protein FtsN
LSELSVEGNTLWRVRVGPYNSIEESNPVRDKLNGMGIKPTVIKSSKS